MTRRYICLLAMTLLVGATACGNNDENNTKPPVLPDLSSIDMGKDMPGQDMSDMGDMVDMTKNTTDPLVVNNQSTPLPNGITIQRIAVDAPGWLVIYSDDNGKNGDVLATIALVAGEQTDVAVTLNRAIVDGETLHAQLHAESPEDGNFTNGDKDGEDPVLTDKDGEDIRISFTVAVNLIDPSVIVDNQTLTALKKVTIKSVTSAGPGWIVIHADNNGTPGEVLGQTIVAEGANLDVEVTLSRDAIDQEVLYAMLHKEDPVDGAYTFDGQNNEDPPVIGSNNQVIAPPFTVTVPAVMFDPTITVEDQTMATPIDLVIKRAVSNGPGWIVIHEDNNGVPGASIGRGFVGNGETLNVEITLNRDAVDQEKLHARLHVDAPADGRYTFTAQNGEDALAMNMGQPIEPSFTVTVNEIINPELLPYQVVDLLTPREILVQSVTSDGPGWVVVYELDNNGNPSTIIGKKQVAAGTVADLAVTLDRDAINQETVLIKLHKDDPADNNFTNDVNANEDVQALDAQGLPAQGQSVLVQPQASMTVAAQVLDNVSTVITIETVTALKDGWLIIQDADANSNPGAIIGQLKLAKGQLADVNITLTRPAVDAELLFASLHEDDPADNVFDPNADPLVTDDQGTEVQNAFSPLLDPGVPAVRFTVKNVGASAYQFSSVEPIEFIGSVSGLNVDNPSLTLNAGWRYAFTNDAFPTHPIEFVTLGAMRSTDTVLMSQDANVTGSLESDVNIEWTSDMKTVVFTVPSQNSVIDGYRCSIASHASMRGTIATP